MEGLAGGDQTNPDGHPSGTRVVFTMSDGETDDPGSPQSTARRPPRSLTVGSRASGSMTLRGHPTVSQSSSVERSPAGSGVSGRSRPSTWTAAGRPSSGDPRPAPSPLAQDGRRTDIASCSSSSTRSVLLWTPRSTASSSRSSGWTHRTVRFVCLTDPDLYAATADWSRHGRGSSTQRWPHRRRWRQTCSRSRLAVARPPG